MTMTTINVDLGIDVRAEFDQNQAISLIDATKLLRGRRGNPAYNTVLRWTREDQGYTVGRLRVVLPTLLLNGVRWTMPAWVKAFERARDQLGTEQRERKNGRKVGPQPIRQRVRLHAEADALLAAQGVTAGLRPPTPTTQQQGDKRASH